MKKRRPDKTLKDKIAHRHYVAMKLELDYLLLSLYDALSRKDHNYRLTLLDDLYEVQQVLSDFEDEYPHFTRIYVTI